MKSKLAVLLAAAALSACTPPLGSQLSTSSSPPLPAASSSAAPPAASSSAAPPAASSSAAPPATASPPPPYDPLPAVHACAACPWPGTGCAPGSETSCALDPKASWDVRLDRVKPVDAGETRFCLVSDGAGRGCGKATAPPKKGWRKLAPDADEPATVSLSAEDLVGLTVLHLTTDTTAALAAVPSLRVDAALFAEGLLLRDADGDEAVLHLSLGKPPQAPRARLPSPEPDPKAGANSASGAWKVDVHRHADPMIVGTVVADEERREVFTRAFAQAKAAAGRVTAIDAGLAGYRRSVGRAHRATGGELWFIAFFDGDRMVRAHIEVPHGPPVLHMDYYFERDRLFAARSSTLGEEGTTSSMTYHDDDGLFWRSGPNLAERRKPAAKPIFGEIRAALATPEHRIPDESVWAE